MADGKHIRNGTKLVTAGRRTEWTGAIVNPPVWRASTHLYPNMAALREAHKRNADGTFYYGRRGAPTQWALAEALTELEPGAAGTVLYPSGVAAISGALMSVLRAGDVLLISDNAYEPSRALGRGLLKDFGVETRFFDPLDLAGFEHAVEGARAVLLEAPGSLTMEVSDIPALARIARQHGAITLVDNTWASPLGFHALEHGADIAIMSLTKHVGGHSDLMMGSATAGEELYQRLRRTAQALGHVVSPDDAALALRGLRTMGIRLQQETSSALEIARWLDQRFEIERVLCPMLPSDPSHVLWQRDFVGGCGLFSLLFRSGDAAARDRFIDALELFGIGYSFGGFESLVIPLEPQRSTMEWRPDGMSFGVRLSIGLEDPEDLISDLERGLTAWRG